MTHLGHDPWGDCGCDNEPRYDPTPWKTDHERAAAVERLQRQLAARAARDNRAAGRHQLAVVRVFLLPDEVQCICGATVPGAVPAADRSVTVDGQVILVGPDLTGLRCPYDVAAVPS